MIQIAVVCFGAVLILLGLWGLARPNGFMGLIRKFSSGTGYFVASAMRFLLAIVLWYAAPASRIPLLMKMLAGISLGAAAILVVMGRDQYERLLGWVLDLDQHLVRMAVGFVIAFGGLLIWLVV